MYISVCVAQNYKVGIVVLSPFLGSGSCSKLPVEEEGGCGDGSGGGGGGSLASDYFKILGSYLGYLCV